MKFYSRVVNKPNSIIEEVKHGTQTVKQVKLCTFINGIFETEEPELIIKLKKRPDLFRTDKPWIQRIDWKTTKEGKKLLEEGKELGIDCRHLREKYLKQLIHEKKYPIKKNMPEEPEFNEKELISSKPPKAQITESEPTTKETKVDYKEMIKLAKEAGIRGYGVKKEILKKKLKESGVNV